MMPTKLNSNTLLYSTHSPSTVCALWDAVGSRKTSCSSLSHVLRAYYALWLIVNGEWVLSAMHHEHVRNWGRGVAHSRMNSAVTQHSSEATLLWREKGLQSHKKCSFLWQC